MSDGYTLNQLLPEAAIAEIVELANAGHYRKRDFMPIIERYRAELLEKGVDADYLGYVLEHQIGRALDEARAQDLTTSVEDYIEGN